MNEMIKLLILIMSAGWKFNFRTVYDGYQLQLLDKNDLDFIIDDAVWHGSSHGNQEGLLETLILNDCKGYETALQVYDGWKKMMEEES